MRVHLGVHSNRKRTQLFFGRNGNKSLECNARFYADGTPTSENTRPRSASANTAGFTLASSKNWRTALEPMEACDV